jgi:TetR/AcrR family transcriptional regulator
VAETSTEPARSERRRARAPEERQRDPERTRQRILQAALEVFGAKGYAGARVAEIAERAGVNHQLISYYFDGKEGLYDELLARWHRREAAMAAADQELEDVVVAYLAANHEQPDMARLLIWDGLTSPDRRSSLGEGAPGDEAPEVADLRRRQAEGELADELDPGFVLLALMGAVSAATTMPEMAARLSGLDPRSDEFVDRYGDQLRRLVRRLGDRRP